MKNNYTLIKMGILMPSWNALNGTDIAHGTFFDEQIKNEIKVSTFSNSDKISIGGIDYTPMDIYVGFETPNGIYHLVVGNIGTFDIKIVDMFDKRSSSLSRNIKSDFTKSDNYCVLVNAEMKLLRSEDFIVSFVLAGDDINIRKKDIYIKFDWNTETDFVINVFNHKTKGNRYSTKTIIENDGITREIKAVIPFEKIVDIIDIKYLYNTNEIVFDTELTYRNIKLSKKTISVNPFYQGLTASVVTGLKLLGYSIKRTEKAAISNNYKE